MLDEGLQFPDEGQPFDPLDPANYDFSFPDSPLDSLRKERAEYGSAGYQLQRLKGVHDEMIRMHVEGKSNKEIAVALDRTTQSVSEGLRCELAVERIAELRIMLDMDIGTDTIQLKIHDGAVNAAQYLADVIDGVGQGEGASTNEKVKASIEMLRMDGYQPTQKIEKKVEHGYLGTIGVEHILKRAEEIGPPSATKPILDVPSSVSAGASPQEGAQPGGLGPSIGEETKDG